MENCEHGKRKNICPLCFLVDKAESLQSRNDELEVENKELKIKLEREYSDHARMRDHIQGLTIERDKLKEAAKPPHYCDVCGCRRTSVDALANNELAQTIADLKAAVQSLKNIRCPMEVIPDGSQGPLERIRDIIGGEM